MAIMYRHETDDAADWHTRDVGRVSGTKGSWEKCELWIEARNHTLRFTGQTLDRIFEELVTLDRYRDCIKPDRLKSIDEQVRLYDGLR